MLRCSIEKNKHTFLLRANDRLLPLYAYMTYQPEKGCYQAFRDIGVQFVSVAVYAGDRGINPRSGIRPFQATLESALLHGKPWFVEADVRTLLSRPISQAMPHADPDVNRATVRSGWDLTTCLSRWATCCGPSRASSRITEPCGGLTCGAAGMTMSS